MNETLIANGWACFDKCTCGGSALWKYSNKSKPEYTVKIRPTKNTFSIHKGGATLKVGWGDKLEEEILKLNS